MKAAKKCKHCGEWLEEKPLSTARGNSAIKPPNVDTSVEIKDSATKRIILFIVGGLVLAFIIWLIIASNQKSDWEKAMDEYNSQYTSRTEEPASTYNEVQVYDEETVCSYDEVPDDEVEEYSGSNKYRTDSYDLNSDANAWN